ncbi:MAG: NigD-like protein [Paludibacter sp.]|jgi:hypothetical protein|nr:NigD-like protein [Paludibacter sp.]
MKTIIKTFITLAAITLMFASCNKADDKKNTMYQAIVTVENPDSTTTFYLKTENQLRLFTKTTSFIPANGSRLFVYFTIVEEMPEGSNYDYEVALQGYEDILTKEIFNITPEAQDSIGNDPIEISNLWIASNYLTVEFMVYRSNLPISHYINLVADSSKHYDDSAVHLELRHNARNDYPDFRSFSLASFNLLPLKENAEGDSITLVIHSKEYVNSEKDRTIVYKFSSELNQTRKFDNNYIFPSSAMIK